jgi:hypothetical protein
MVQKAQDRADARAESTMGDPVWDALFTVAYQSTDETDQSESIDPETESEELVVSVPSRPWVTRPPTYRATVVSFHIDTTIHYLLYLQVADAIEQLDLLVKTRRSEINQSKDIKPHVGQPHARRLGESKEKPLPYPGKCDPINLDLVDQIWLAEHPESGSRRMILGWTKPETEEGDLADAEDEGMDEEDWSRGDDDGFIDPQLRRSDLDNGSLEGSDDEDLYADPK